MGLCYSICFKCITHHALQEKYKFDIIIDTILISVNDKQFEGYFVSHLKHSKNVTRFVSPHKIYIKTKENVMKKAT